MPYFFMAVQMVRAAAVAMTLQLKDLFSRTLCPMAGHV